MFAAGPAHAVVILNEDFEGETGLPSGWTLVDNHAGTNNPAFTIVQGHAGAGVFGGNGGHIGDNIDGIPGPGQPNGGWFQAPVTAPASDRFQLDFDVKFEQEGTADDAAILFGDLTAKNYHTIVITETAANNDMFWLVNDDRQGTGDAGTAVDGTNQYVGSNPAPVNEVWYHGKVTWTPTTQRLAFALTRPSDGFLMGSFNVLMDGTQMASGQAINVAPSGTLQFGFGTLNDRASYDNIVLSSGIMLGDTDDDGVVELTDFDPIRDNFRKAVTSRAQGDLVEDGVVDFKDFGEWKTAFLGGGGSLEGVDLSFLSGSVPEPTTVLMFVLATPFLATRRARRTLRRRGIQEVAA